MTKKAKRQKKPGTKSSSKGYAPYGSRREEILGAAIALFAEQGIAGTRMAEIAEHVGIDQAILRYHFPSQELLHGECVQRIIEDHVSFTIAAMEKGPQDPMGLLRTYVQAYFHWGRKQPGKLAIFIYFYHLSAFRPEFTRINEATRKTGRERAAAILFEAIEAGQLAAPRRLRVAELARMIQAMIIGGVFATATETERDWDAGATQAWIQVEALLQWAAQVPKV
jgi:AcrR family transcriptional regulator